MIGKAIGLYFKNGHLKTDPNQRHQANLHSLLHSKVISTCPPFVTLIDSVTMLYRGVMKTTNSGPCILKHLLIYICLTLVQVELMDCALILQLPCSHRPSSIKPKRVMPATWKQSLPKLQSQKSSQHLHIYVLVMSQCSIKRFLQLVERFLETSIND